MSFANPSLKLSWPVLLPLSLLLLLVGAQGLDRLREKPPVRAPHVARAIPAAPAGWSGRDVPLGPSEFLSNEVEKVLNYDEVVYREFTRDGVSFSVYVAYWGAGKMPTQLVASHTPDRCWTENGWHCLEQRYHQTGLFTGTDLKPAEWRRFEPPVGGSTVYVLFWHLVDGRIYDYGDRFNSVPDPVRWWKGAMQQVLRGNREQYFIRLTSSQPFETLQSDPGFAQILRSLACLGLAAPAPGPAPAVTGSH